MHEGGGLEGGREREGNRKHDLVIVLDSTRIEYGKKKQAMTRERNQRRLVAHEKVKGSGERIKKYGWHVYTCKK